MNWNLAAVSALPPDEQEEAIDTIAAQLVADGVTEEELDDLQRLIDRLTETVRQMQRPN